MPDYTSFKDALKGLLGMKVDTPAEKDQKENAMIVQIQRDHGVCGSRARKDAQRNYSKDIKK